MQVIVNGLMTSYELVGKGKTVVLLHGWGDSATTFAALRSALEKKYKVVSINFPGFGGSAKPNGAFTLEDYALFVRDFLRKIDCEQVYGIVGHSNGGAVAIKGLANKILEAEKLVLIASSGVRPSYNAKKKAIKFLANIAKMPTAVLPKKAQLRIKKRIYSAIGSDLFVAEDMQETFKLIVSEDIVAESVTITVPTLLLYGEHDTATPPAYGRRFADAIDGSKLITIDNADHFVHQTHASQVNELVLDFLGPV